MIKLRKNWGVYCSFCVKFARVEFSLVAWSLGHLVYSFKGELNLWSRVWEHSSNTTDSNSGCISFTPLPWCTWNIKGIYIRASQWTLHCLENLYHYRNRKSKEILCEYRNIRDHYWSNVIAGSKRDLKNILVLSMFLSTCCVWVSF